MLRDSIFVPDELSVIEKDHATSALYEASRSFASIAEMRTFGMNLSLFLYVDTETVPGTRNNQGTMFLRHNPNLQYRLHPRAQGLERLEPR